MVITGIDLLISEVTCLVREGRTNEEIVRTIGLRLRLTPRQKEIVNLVKDGCGNKEIAGRLGLAECTVKNHLYKLFRSYGIRNRIELLRLFASDQNGSESAAPPPSGFNHLTPRQKEIALLGAKGLMNREIGENLRVRVHTVKNALREVFDKMGVSSRAELAVMLSSVQSQPKSQPVPQK